jgi:hypothetical protein
MCFSHATRPTARRSAAARKARRNPGLAVWITIAGPRSLRSGREAEQATRRGRLEQLAVTVRAEARHVSHLPAKPVADVAEWPHAGCPHRMDIVAHGVAHVADVRGHRLNGELVVHTAVSVYARAPRRLCTASPGGRPRLTRDDGISNASGWTPQLQREVLRGAVMRPRKKCTSTRSPTGSARRS